MPKQLLFIPGPVTVAEPVLTATGAPMIDHRGPEFKALLAQMTEGMKPVFGTTRAEVLVLGASGTGGLEAAITSVFGPGDRLLACPIGVFGERLIAIARTWGCTVDVGRKSCSLPLAEYFTVIVQILLNCLFSVMPAQASHPVVPRLVRGAPVSKA